MKSVELEIQGMSCDHCVRAVKSALEQVPGVKSSTVRVGHADLQVEDTTARDALVRAVEEEGYRVVGG